MDTFTFVVADEDGGMLTATATITVVGLNDAPQLADDRITLSEQDVSVDGDLLLNDMDVDSGQGDLFALNVGGTTDDNVDVAGNYGTLDWSNDGTSTYTLDRNHAAVQALLPGQSLVDTFAHTISDGVDTNTATLTVTITGFNDAPDAVDDTAGIDLDLNSTVAGALLGNDLAVDDSFTLTAVSGLSQNIGAAFELPSGARLRVEADGMFSYVPNGMFGRLAGRRDSRRQLHLHHRRCSRQCGTPRRRRSL